MSTRDGANAARLTAIVSATSALICAVHAWKGRKPRVERGQEALVDEHRFGSAPKPQESADYCRSSCHGQGDAMTLDQDSQRPAKRTVRRLA